ncbi:hypothetical protein APA_2318 [Pseudanabaena sp. lw0831]|uniref:DUF29 domain-containing protein n=1 Tax=Pseudanabaena sp. lw0831 TaxID=1357935 RepID=UPI001914DE63|nr:DUF29 domain-containing protein [Pseudanabaena sp. lw0831]GBO54370.1 hypothetical protein APA_2318 [Pseudanabaena sp. lw0831]
MLDIKLNDVYSSTKQAKDQYEQDFYAWTQNQAELLRRGKLQGLDLENLAEEIASLGKQQKQELRNRFGVLIGHLLKWEYQPHLRGKSWRITIDLQRDEILELVQENPSLKPYLEEAIAKSYKQAIALVVKETPFDKNDLPSACLYTFDQIFDQDFYPN